METFPGTHNWKLICRREWDRAVILRAATCDERAALPETLWGLPVMELGDHALAVGNYTPTGMEVGIIGAPAPEEAPWDNSRLRELTLPPALERAGDYALFRCAALKTLRLWDRARVWGGGALMNCRELDTLVLTCSGGEGEVLSGFAGELSRELDVILRYPAGEPAWLIFPEYQELYEENSPAHHFDYNIRGAGYRYHHCFRDKQFHLAEYDALWDEFLGMEYDPVCAIRLALRRLRYPRELQPRAERGYLDYLRRRGTDAVRALLAEGDARGLALLLPRLELGREALAEVCETARQSGAVEAVALLLEERHRRFPAGTEKTFDL